MFGFPSRKSRLGLDITSSEIRLAVLTGSGLSLVPQSLDRAALPAGMVNESFSFPAIADPEGLSGVLRDLLQRTAPRASRRTGVSLPDALFRVQTFEFDRLPGNAEDRERLIRWRFEKSAAFDASDTVLRYQVLRREERGVTLIACIAKREVIAQYEALLIGLGLEPWLIGPASFHTLNFYFPLMARKSSVFALAVMARNGFTTMVMEHGATRFYRFKEIKTGKPDEVRDRLMRELDDSLHFYTHMDRAQSSEIERLYLTGDPGALDAVAPALKEGIAPEVEVLSPSSVLQPPQAAGGDPAWPGAMAAALGAGGMA